MSDSSIKNPVEQSMLVIVILAFSWPLTALVLSGSAFFFGDALQIRGIFWMNAYLILAASLAIGCLYWIARIAVLAFLKTGFRRQLLIPAAMFVLFLCSFFPLGVVIAAMGAAAFAP